MKKNKKNIKFQCQLCISCQNPSHKQGVLFFLYERNNHEWIGIGRAGKMYLHLMPSVTRPSTCDAQGVSTN